MRISVIRTLAACVLLGFVSGTANFPVCGSAFNFEDLPFCSLSYNNANPTANPNVMAKPAAAASLSQVTSRTFAVQVQGTGNVRPTSSATYTVTYTIQGVSRAQIATL
jgi:hypothetical protein